MALKRCPIIPKIYEFVILHGKRDFANVTKLGILRRGGDHGLYMWAQCNHRVPCKRKEEAERSEAERALKILH